MKAANLEEEIHFNRLKRNRKAVSKQFPSYQKEWA